MNPPNPKAEIVCVSDHGIPSRLFFYVASEDAATWLATEAPKFGGYTPAIHLDKTEHSLFVSPLYDPSEVAAYLCSMGSHD